jgi:hypothetical protein
MRDKLVSALLAIALIAVVVGIPAIALKADESILCKANTGYTNPHVSCDASGRIITVTGTTALYAPHQFLNTVGTAASVTVSFASASNVIVTNIGDYDAYINFDGGTAAYRLFASQTLALDGNMQSFTAKAITGTTTIQGIAGLSQ